MKYIALLTVVLGLASCAQTGDPSSGGLFGWSEPMYKQDMNNKSAYLGDVRSDTAQQRARAASLQGQVNSQQR
jgi:hypothetical protein